MVRQVREEEEYYEEDSVTKESRIRRVAQFGSGDDIGNEGNKSTYLRPSRGNDRSSNDVSRSLILQSGSRSR